MNELKITSPAFETEGWIPNCHSGFGEDISSGNLLPEHLPKGAVIEQPFYMEQGPAYGKHCYRGSKPPFNWNHRYCFTVYVLDTMLTVSMDSDQNGCAESNGWARLAEGMSVWENCIRSYNRNIARIQIQVPVLAIDS